MIAYAIPIATEDSGGARVVAAGGCLRAQCVGLENQEK
jgi:hypothetical protein